MVLDHSWLRHQKKNTTSKLEFQFRQSITLIIPGSKFNVVKVLWNVYLYTLSPAN